MCTLQISIEMVAIDRIVTSQCPGGQWLPFRGRNAVPSLSSPYATVSLLCYLEVVGSNPDQARNFFTWKFIGKINCKFYPFNRPVSFNLIQLLKLLSNFRPIKMRSENFLPSIPPACKIQWWTSFQCYLSTIPSWFLSYLPSFTDLLRPWNFLQFPSFNTLTHCMAALLRIVDSVRRKELGRQTGRRSSPMEQTPPAQLVPGKEVGAKKT